MLLFIDLGSFVPGTALDSALDTIRSWHESSPNRRVIVCTDALPNVRLDAFSVVQLGDDAAAERVDASPLLATLPMGPSDLSERREVLAPLTVALVPSTLGVVAVAMV